LKANADIQPASAGLPFPFQTHLDSIPQGVIPTLELHHPQPSASTSAYVSPPSAVSDRIEHPASPPLPTGMTPFTNPESTLPAQLKLDAFISRDLAMKTISLFFEHVSLVLNKKMLMLQVSCIMPLIHKPSFMADLEAGEEERNPIFFALILQMISMTLIHVRSLWVIVLMSSYQSLTFQYRPRMYGHARTDVCDEQMLLLIVMQRDWSWICV
jgi:hypothetical protein